MNDFSLFGIQDDISGSFLGHEESLEGCYLYSSPQEAYEAAMTYDDLLSFTIFRFTPVYQKEEHELREVSTWKIVKDPQEMDPFI